MKNIFLIIIFISFSKFALTELPLAARLKMEKIDQAIYSGKIDNARILLIQFEKEFPITKEKKYGAIHNSFKSDIERASGNLDLALKYMLKSLTFKESLGESSWYIYHKVANIYFEKKAYEMAKIYADSSMNFGKNPELISRKKNMNNRILGYYYLNKKNYSKAKLYYEEILAINKELDCEKALIYNNLFTINFQNKDYIAAKSNLDSAENIAKNNYCNAYQYLAMSYDKRVQLAIHQKDYRSAFLYLKKNKTLVDSIDVEERIRVNKDIEKKYESVIIKTKNKVLTQKNLEVENKNKMFAILILISILALLIITFFLFLIRKRNNTIILSKMKVDKLNELHQKIFNVISHDFNGSFISLQFLLDEVKSNRFSLDEFNLKINDVQLYLNQSNYVLQNLTNWAKIELGEHILQKEKLSVYLLIEKIKNQLSFQLKSKNIDLINNVNAELFTEIPEEYLLIMFRNIINNAIKFSFRNQKILVNNIENVIFVQDFGKGIDSEKLKQIFQQKVEPEIGTENEFGFGIGLKIVKEISDKFRCNISIDSELNKGTKISIKI